MSNQQSVGQRGEYSHFLVIPSRWMDNDIYGHINNVQYYSFFDTAVNRYLIDSGVLDIHDGAVIGLVVETQCTYFSSLSFPEQIEAGIRITRMGNSSVRYEVGLFKQGADSAAAEGHFIHVYVSRDTRRPVALPPEMKTVLEQISI